MNTISKLVWFLMISVFLFGCGGTVNRYHKVRAELVPMEPFKKEKLCEKLKKFNVDCQDARISAKVDEFIKFVEVRLPKGYFEEDKKDTEDTPDRSPRSLKTRVEVTALPSRKGARNPPSLFTTITAEGQQAIINYLLKRSQSLEDDAKALEKLFSVLRHEVSQVPTSDPFDRYREFSLTVSASLNSSSPADRLERVYAFILIPKGGKIFDIDELQTERPKVDIGKLT